MLHSRLRPAERYEEWRRLRTGEARVCVGPRSAVFAPIERSRPDRRRRGARRLLQARRRPPLRRARRRRASAPAPAARCCCWAAPPRARRACAPRSRSATPRLRLPDACRRASAAAGQRARHARRVERRACTRRPRSALAQVRRARGKAIVLLNRRGWSNFLSCRSCGRVWSCPDCDVALVLHRARRATWPAITADIASRAPAALRAVRLDLGRAPRRGHRARAARSRRRARRRRR